MFLRETNAASSCLDSVEAQVCSGSLIESLIDNQERLTLIIGLF